MRIPPLCLLIPIICAACSNVCGVTLTPDESTLYQHDVVVEIALETEDLNALAKESDADVPDVQKYRYESIVVG